MSRETPTVFCFVFPHTQLKLTDLKADAARPYPDVRTDNLYILLKIPHSAHRLLAPPFGALPMATDESHMLHELHSQR